MNQIVESQRSPGLMKLFFVIVLLVTGIGIGPLIQILHIGIREIVIVILSVLMLSLILIPDVRVLRFGFTLWIITFAFGWRTIYITPLFNIHPTEMVAWLLVFAAVARAIVNRSDLDFSLPVPVVLLMLVAVLGVITALVSGQLADVVFEEFKVFLAIPLAYYVVRWNVKTKEDWESAARWTIGVVVYIGFLGVMEYFAPGASSSFSRLGGGAGNAGLVGEAATDFGRVGFSFYGNFTAGFVIFTFLGFTVYELMVLWGAHSGTTRILLSIALLIQLAGIYLSGFRGLWYAVVVFVLLYAVFQPRAWVLVGAGLFALPLLPINFINRFQSIFSPQFADSSQYDRIYRATVAANLFWQSPLTGVGWGGSGYVHSDLIQIAANLGVFGILFFILWTGEILWRLYRLMPLNGWFSAYARLMFPMVCGLLVIFAGEGTIAFVQLAMPIWFLFAMCHRLVNLSDDTNEQASADG